MKYVMSDLHGEYDAFVQMLKKINFSKDDELYILGDIFDRGDEPIKILEYIWDHSNIFLIKGNHEYMFEKCYEDKSNLDIWFCNGGKNTFMEIVSKGQDFMDKTYRYIKNLPLILKVDEFILIHAGLYLPSNYKDLNINEIIEMQIDDYLLWDRDFFNSNDFIEGHTIISGHTPTISIQSEASIIKKTGKILIDCGAVFKDYNGQLACLCLDNLEEFYISR